MLAPGSADDACAGAMSQLDQQDAQSAAGTQDEDPFLRPDGRHLNQAHGGSAVMQERGRLGRPQRLRYGDNPPASTAVRSR